MKKLQNIVKQYSFYFIFILLLAFWQILGMMSLLPKLILPTPYEIIKAFIQDFPLIMHHCKITLLEAFFGLSIGVLVAWGLAILMELIEGVYKAIFPFVVISQTIPTVAIAPILVLWMGYGMSPKITLVAITTIFPIIVSIIQGFKSCDLDSITFLKLMNASELQILWHVKIPTSLHYFFSGLKISVSYAIIGAVVAEWLGGFEGLGVYMTRVRKAFAYDQMFAVIAFISILSLLLMHLVTYVQRKTLYWEQRKEE